MGPHRSLPLFAHAAGMNQNDGRVGGIHVRLSWSEHEVDAPRGGEPGVVIESARIAREVFGRAELQRIHEDAHDDDVGNAFGFVDQSEMSLVEGAHRRHERDALALRAHIGNYVPHLVDGIYLLHARSCVGRPGKSRSEHRPPRPRWRSELPQPSRRSA